MVNISRYIPSKNSKIEGNIIDLLRFAEDRIYRDYIKSSDRDQRFSKIKAFNIVHGIILYATGLKEAKPNYIIDEECEKASKPAPHVEITIRPAKEALKQAKYGEAAANAMTLIPGPYAWIGVGLTIVLSVADIIESENFLTLDNVNSIEAIGNVIYHNSNIILKKVGNVVYESVGTALAQYSNAATVFSIIQDLLYNSYANFVGEIKVTVSTYCEEYQFKGKYNIMGDIEGDYMPNCKPIQKSNFILQVPEDNKTTINYKIFEDGMFKTGEFSDFMW